MKKRILKWLGLAGIWEEIRYVRGGLESKINGLTKENESLKSKVEELEFKIVHPAPIVGSDFEGKTIISVEFIRWKSWFTSKTSKFSYFLKLMDSEKKVTQHNLNFDKP